MPLSLQIDGKIFRDAKGREVTLHGINVAGDAKNPARPDLPSHEVKNFFDGDSVSFVGRPFSLDSAPHHFARLRSWGYNTIRYIFTWEALEAAGPGQYDEEFIQHTISTLRIAKQYGFYVFMDPHQDVWSRFTGGSGAPMWTLYACGLDPEKFRENEAALVQNTWPDPAKFPKMVWATSYTRMACHVLFTVFFAGRAFAPKAKLDGKNIQDYLQDQFIGACKHLALRIREAGDLYGDCVIGFESVNEPNRGLVGQQDLTVVPEEQRLKLGTSPTAWQAILTGSGVSCEVDTWGFGGMGPYKSGTQLVDPHGETAWLAPEREPARYGWTRDQDWRLGECIWAQHGLWDPSNNTLLKQDYFSRDPDTGLPIDYEYFTNHFFLSYYRKYRDAIRDVFPDCIMFCQPPVLELPPSIKETEDDDPNMVYAPHWYDGVTLMNKHWNRLWNVDVLGVLRGRYLTPAFAVKLGESAIRNCFRDQLSSMRNEGLEYMGVHPCVFTELGVPFDMDDCYAYKTGDYSSQVRAMDSNFFALEGSGVGFALWNYTASNNHFWGDNWDGEDLSIVSRDDPEPLAYPGPSRRSEDAESMSVHSRSRKGGASAHTRAIESSPEKNSNGFRAAAAFVRPTPIVSNGRVLSYGFDLQTCEFSLKINSPHSASHENPTEIFLPTYHFPKDRVKVEVSSGKWEIVTDEREGYTTQVLLWWNGKGEQSVRINGVADEQAVGDYAFNPCRENGCCTM